MKVVLVFAALVAVAVARPQEPSRPIVPILDSQLTRDDYGQFASSYLSGDGTRVSEQGALVPNNEKTGYVLVKQGDFSYYAPDAQLIKVTWTADAEGFHAQGDHLPTTPATPSV